MRRRRILLTTLVLAALCIAAMLGYYYFAVAESRTSITTSKLNTDTSLIKPIATNNISIQNYSYSPVFVTAKKGTTVIWLNNDTVEHSVVSSDGLSGLSSSMLVPGASYGYVFDKVGTFKYHCSMYPDMQGTILVTE